MDELRQFRFAITPFVFGLWFAVSFLFWGSPRAQLVACSVIARPAGEVTAIAAIAAAGILPVGFLISSVTIACLRFISVVFGRSYEAAHVDRRDAPSTEDDASASARRLRRMLATATLARRDLPERLSDWITRRWDAFIAWANSTVAVVAAWLIVLATRGGACPQVAKYSLATAVVSAVLWLNAHCAWKETMGMLEFHAERVDGGTPPPDDALSALTKAEGALESAREALEAARNAVHSTSVIASPPTPASASLAP